MDVFSWFRQKRQGSRKSGGGNNSDGEKRASGANSRSVAPREIVIPFDPTPTVGFAVYFHHSGAPSELPDADQCQAIAEAWLQTHTREPLRSALFAFLREGMVTFAVRERGNRVPDPPDDMVRAYNPGETEERRYRNATHIVFIATTDLAAPPRAGFWAVVGAARALCESLPGSVILDPEFPRLLPLTGDEPDEIPATGDIHIVRHIVLPYSHDGQNGLLWMTTKGMSRFGLPDLEIRDVPPNLAQSLMPVLNGMAQKLMAASAQFATPSDIDEENEDELPEELFLQGFPCPAEVRLSVADIARAYGDAPNETSENENDWGKSSLVRLTVSRQRGGEGTFVRLVPPRVENSDKATPPGVWLNQVLGDLFESEPHLAAVDHSDEAMQAAHNEAVSQLGQVRARFGAGFHRGEVLHVKYGFPTDEPSAEDDAPDAEIDFTEDDGGHEYMWIAVTSWSEGGRVRGLLANDPQYRRDLQAGQNVEISEEDIYDWMIVYPDGRHEGAFTNAVLEHLDDEAIDE